MIPQFRNVADFEAYYRYIAKVENAYWTRDVLNNTDGPVTNWSLIVNVACQSYSSTDNASESDRCQYFEDTTNYIDDFYKLTAAVSEVDDASFWSIAI